MNLFPRKRWTRFRVALLPLTLCVCSGAVSSALSQTPRPKNRELAFVGARIYRSPFAKPIVNGVVLIEDGEIAAVGRKGRVQIPRGADLIDCTGLTMMAGFWNSHVHFIRPEWANAASISAQRLSRQLQDMLIGYGFTTVFETADFDLDNTNDLRRRIESGEVDGPRILTTGEPLLPENGTPDYLKPLLRQLGVSGSVFEADSTEQARIVVAERARRGADAIKIFSASRVGDKTVMMPLDVVKAITAEAHRFGRQVFVHPHNADGINVALEGGVDILAHPVPNAGPWAKLLVLKMKRANIALIPTLTLMRLEENDPARGERVVAVAVDQLRAYAAAGGQILFGTDIGYITDYDPTEEYLLMARAGMNFRQILVSLTVAPASRFTYSQRVGTIKPGMSGDLVLVSGDPASDIRALSNVRYVGAPGE
jgi:imidazolonepropionase-like amidohydrolase